jgi:hypothetical protein
MFTAQNQIDFDNLADSCLSYMSHFNFLMCLSIYDESELESIKDEFNSYKFYDL